MKFSLLAICLLYFPLAQAKTVATYTYKRAQKPVQKSIQLKELKSAYDIVRRSTFTPPSPEDFFQDYLRFKQGVEVALNERSLVKNPGIDKMINNPFLKQAFHQELYKALAELKLKTQMRRLDKTAAGMPKKTLQRLYAKEPEFNIFFIAVNHPINPQSQQIQEAKRRADKIYSQVTKSKKPFLELVTLYSDDKVNGALNINRSRANILPEVYAELKKMRNNSISKPIRVASGYVIVKLNRKLPFSEANEVAIKANYFNEQRTKIFNAYFNGLKSSFDVKIVDKNLIKTL